MYAAIMVLVYRTKYANVKRVGLVQIVVMMKIILKHSVLVYQHFIIMMFVVVMECVLKKIRVIVTEGGGVKDAVMILIQ